ncbi:MAG: hypothetical protein P4N59_10800 [Negativicutes bacterium]|nr:hypothetical protein [Negativicutes bacterium]
MDEKKNIKPDQAQIDKWKAQFGEVYEITSDADEEQVFYFRKPDRGQLSRFAKKVMQDALKAMHTLIFDTLLFPSQEVVNKLFTEKPGMAIPLGSELQTIVGTNQDFTHRKL